MVEETFCQPDGTSRVQGADLRMEDDSGNEVIARSPAKRGDEAISYLLIFKNEICFAPLAMTR